MRRIWIGLATIALGQSLVAQSAPDAPRPTPYSDARPLLEALKTDAWPRALAAVPPARIEQLWPAWLSQEDRSIRSRIEQGDEDSIINLLLFGTTFTARPRVSERELAVLAKAPSRVGDRFTDRVEDLMSALSTIQGNDRLDFIRDTVSRRGIDVKTDSGRSQLRRYLLANLTRVATEISTYDHAIESAALTADPGAEFLERATLFRNRGLSSDTSIFTDYAVERALKAILNRGDMPGDSVQRVAIVGPGLDFVDKHEGFDFYPPQTVQPFAIIDSLFRLELAKPGKLQIATFDLSPRINQHLMTARREAENGHGYVVHLPRDTSVAWHPDLDDYWTTFGDRIGDAEVLAPFNAAAVETRAVKIRPSIVTAITPTTLNVVSERLDIPSSQARFDIVVATNVLVYYDAFQQSLALINIASMLRPGGILIVNGRVLMLPSVPLESGGQLDVIYTYRPETGEVGDRVSWFRRRS